MQSTLLRLAVALLTFGVGVSATMLWIAYGTPEAKVYRVKSCHMRPIAPLPPAPPSMDAPPPPPALPPPARAPITGGLLNGKAISKPQPVYPSAAKAARVSGTVYVHVVLNESGRVISAEAVSGHQLLHDVAVEAARDARFSPTLVSGQPVKVSGIISYNFVLQ
ncbi:MAG TPA: energy transducer TonB [Pyrinomonadaceae bacterium]|nr:energy transducer TonB [Pyrinomonadaceae bacterium]